MATLKPGIKTTEFWTAALTTGCAVLSEVFHTKVGVNVPKDSTFMAGAVSVGYVISRGIHKFGVIKYAENVIGLETQENADAAKPAPASPVNNAELHGS